MTVFKHPSPPGHKGLFPFAISTVVDGTSSLSLPVRITYLPEVDSTNRYLLELSPSELQHGVAVTTDFQSAGRGRLGRRWAAPARSSVLLSIALQLPGGVAAQDVVMMGALTVRDAIRSLTALGATMKWPNDVVVGNRKVSGILTETVRRGPDSYAILGIGINVNIEPAAMEPLSPDATSLSIELGAEISRETLTVHVFESVDMWYGCLQRDPDEIFEAWSTGLDTLGKSVQVRDVVGLWQGTAMEVRRDGGLAVRKDNGEVHVVFAADVSVRPFEGFTSAD